ncbi:MAG: hypothetical protein JJ864_17190 [Rhizobiaceae bacterium]|nr:hypothetical protein [Rhizobiaceae bacterium]
MSGHGSALAVLYESVRIYRESLRRKHSERVLNGLPARLRKDIGWPDSGRFSGTD